MSVFVVFKLNFRIVGSYTMIVESICKVSAFILLPDDV